MLASHILQLMKTNPMLLSNENNTVTWASEGDIPKFPILTTLVSVETDARLAKTFCSVGHAYKRRVEKLSQSSLRIHAFVEQFTAVVIKDLKSVEAKNRNVCRILEKYVEQRVRRVKYAHNAVRNLMKLPGSGDSGSNDDLTVLRHQLVIELTPANEELYQLYFMDHVLWNEWHVTTCTLSCPAKFHVPAHARTMVDRLHDSWQHLSGDWAVWSLAYNDEQFRELHLHVLLEAECQPTIDQLAYALAYWYKMARGVYLQVHGFDKDLDADEKCLEALLGT